MMRVALFIIALAMSGVAFAQEKSEGTAISGVTTTERSFGERLDQKAVIAEMFKLTLAEWERFELLKKGPLGYKNPDIEPHLALAMYAKNANEQRRFLELYAMQQKDIWDRGKLVQTKFREAYRQLFPNELPINQDAIYTDPQQVHPKDRFILAVDNACDSCIDKARAFINQTRVFKRNGIDIFIKGAATNAQVIDWAKTALTENDIASRDITLNTWNSHLEEIIENSQIGVVAERNSEIRRIDSLSSLIK